MAWLGFVVIFLCFIFVLYFSSASSKITNSMGIRQTFWPCLLQTSLADMQPSPRRFITASPNLLTPIDMTQWYEAKDMCPNVKGLKSLPTLSPPGLWVLPTHIPAPAYYFLPYLPSLDKLLSLVFTDSGGPLFLAQVSILMLPSPV